MGENPSIIYLQNPKNGDEEKVMTIIEKLKDYMKENNLKQVDIAKMLGVRKQRVNDWVRGVCSPRATYYEKIVELIERN